MGRGIVTKRSSMIKSWWYQARNIKRITKSWHPLTILSLALVVKSLPCGPCLATVLITARVF
jgi:hypothetical protein